MRTIRQQLVLAMLVTTVACVLGAGYLMYHALLHEINELADLQLRQLAVALPHEAGANTALSAPEDPEEEYILQAWDTGGRLVYAGHAPVQLAPLKVDGFAYTQARGGRWRVFGQTRNGRYVQVAQPMTARDALAADMALSASWPLLLFAVALVGAMLLVVRRALRPLENVARLLAGQAPGHAQALDMHGLPPDLAPIARAINALLVRFDDALAAQKVFVADAAHELRSPLTALKLQLQLAERAGDDATRRSALAKVHARLDRSTHLVNQLLHLARHETAQNALAFTDVNLGELLEEAVADHSALADARAIDLGIVNPTDIVVQGHREALLILVNNLLDNALRYIQHGGRIDVTLSATDGHVQLTVADNGPGVAVEHLPRLFDRFFRPEGNAVAGCGLGLAIVRNIADHHEATVQVANGAAGVGFTVTVAFRGSTRRLD